MYYIGGVVDILVRGHLAGTSTVHLLEQGRTNMTLWTLLPILGTSLLFQTISSHPPKARCANFRYCHCIAILRILSHLSSLAHDSRSNIRVTGFMSNMSK